MKNIFLETLREAFRDLIDAMVVMIPLSLGILALIALFGYLVKTKDTMRDEVKSQEKTVQVEAESDEGKEVTCSNSSGISKFKKSGNTIIHTRQTGETSIRSILHTDTSTPLSQGSKTYSIGYEEHNLSAILRVNFYLKNVALIIFRNDTGDFVTADEYEGCG